MPPVTAPVKPPTSEVGTGASVGTLSWGEYVDETERVPELRWPRSVIEYDRMRNDSQVTALLAGFDLPMRNFTWQLRRNGASDDVVYRLSEEWGLPIEGEVEEVDDSESRINHDDHLRHALLARTYGHMFMEQVVTEDPDGWFRYKKLAPRMPRRIDRIETEDDGGLKGIRLNVTRTGQLQAPLITIDRLVAFVWDREGDQWTGRSALRPLYGNWLLKQRLMRVDATKHERNGLGIPFARATIEGIGRRALAAAARMATQLRAGKNSGGALPYGTDLDIKGVQGNLPDTLASIKYHDECMARAMLMMFIMLGQTESGSRALGDSFVDFHYLALRATAKWYASIMNKHVFRDWVLWNVPETENRNVPRLVWKSPPAETTVADFVSLLDAGAVTMDSELEAWVRGNAGMPPNLMPKSPAGRSYAYDLDYGVLTIDERRSQIGLDPLPNGEGEKMPEPAATRTAVDVAARRRAKAQGARIAAQRRRKAPRMHQGATGSIPLPNRTLRRQPFEYEVTASVNFAAMDASHDDAVASLIAVWQDVRKGHINEIVDIIAGMDSTDVAAFALVEATAGAGVDAIGQIMLSVAESAAEGAVGEAEAQGRTVPDLFDTFDLLTARAEAVDTLLTRSISEAASRRATALAGGALAPDDIANEVRNYLEGLSDAFLEQQFSGVVAQAQNVGRAAVFEVTQPDAFYASELLDTSTCVNCKEVDGKEYDTMAEAQADYPTGGYKNCLGQGACRGTIVGLYL